MKGDLDTKMADTFGAPVGNGKGKYDNLSKVELVALLEARDALEPANLKKKSRPPVELPVEGDLTDVDYLRKEGRRELHEWIEMSQVDRFELLRKISGTRIGDLGKLNLSEAERRLLLGWNLSKYDDAGDEDREGIKVMEVRMVDPLKVKQKVLENLADLYKMAVSDTEGNYIDMDQPKPKVFLQYKRRDEDG